MLLAKLLSIGGASSSNFKNICIHLLGDERLLRESYKFRRLRFLLPDLGIRIVHEEPLLKAYLASVLDGLDFLTQRKTLVYDKNLGNDIDRADALQNIGPNVYLVHESLHLSLRSSLGTPKDPTAIVCEEALAQSMEWLIGLEMHSALSQLAWRLQSPVQIHPAIRQTAMALINATSDKTLYELILHSFLSSLFLRDKFQKSDFKKICDLLKLEPSSEMFSLFKIGFDMSDRFRYDTVWGYVAQKSGITVEHYLCNQSIDFQTPLHAINGLNFFREKKFFAGSRSL